MRLSDLLIVKTAPNGAVVIQGKGRNQFRVIGCSAGSSASMAPEVLSLASFQVNRGSKVLIALNIYERDTKSGYVQDAFLTAQWLDGNAAPTVDLDAIWVPEFPDRHGQIHWHSEVGGYTLTVQIDEVNYTTGVVKNDREAAPQTVYLENGGDLLCKYLIGAVGRNAVKAAAKTPTERQRVAMMERRIVARLRATINAMAAITKDLREMLKLATKQADYAKAIQEVTEFVNDRSNWGYFTRKETIRNRILEIIKSNTSASRAVSILSMSAEEFCKLSREELAELMDTDDSDLLDAFVGMT